ncbi:MAG: signal peptidase I [Candidatus Hydrogenedentota bacterium]
MCSFASSAEAEAPSAPPAADKLRHELWDLVKAVVLFLVLFLLMKTFVIEGYPVHGDSMTPTLHEGDRILVFKLPVTLQRLPFLHGLQPLEAGDIVVFDSPVETGRRYVKRVVAVGPPLRSESVVRAATDEAPAVAVRYEDGTVYVNHQRAAQGYLAPVERSDPGRHAVDLGAGDIYVLGDHRSVSKDSRRFGPINLDHVVGRAVLRFWPFHNLGLL